MAVVSQDRFHCMYMYYFKLLLGILDPDEKPEDNPDDEILAELKKKQGELRALSQHNLSIAKRLYKLAKEEIQRQDLRKKLAAADAEVNFHIQQSRVNRLPQLDITIWSINYQDSWSLVTGSLILKYRSVCQKCLVFQVGWSIIAMVSQDRILVVFIETCELSAVTAKSKVVLILG